MNKKYLKIKVLIICYLFLILNSYSQSTSGTFVNSSGQLKYSLLDNWYSRKLKESSMLSGNTIELFEVGQVSPNSNDFDLKLKDNSSPWSTTNIYAKMVLDIGTTRVIPEIRENGYCARLETKIRKDNIVGVKLEVLLAGTLFLGEKIEPVHGVKDPEKNVSQGIPFTKKPVAVKFDYKYHLGKNRVKATNSADPVNGEDKAEFCVILQKRWEDEHGDVFATRIGGNRQFFTGNHEDWINGAEFPVFYGDATQLPEYNEKTMGLIPGVGTVYVKNSKGVLVPLVETGWGNSSDEPTHMIMYFTSSYDGIKYIGSTESVLWVDNIELIY